MEKRNAHRIRVNLRARYASQQVALDGWVANLSRHGLFLRSEYLDALGSRVTLELALPGEPEPLNLAGEVVRVDDGPLGSGMGIQFERLAPMVRRQLANFMIERSYQALP
jgi:uncharacterized protein (TIGR02266 family)